MMEQLLQNWLCWVILVLALVCYYQLLLVHLDSRSLERASAGEPLASEECQSSLRLQQEFSGVLINALPLLGLLGTIIGLLSCFAGIASDGASSEWVSSGIAEALLTTQLGLVCAVPGWLLLAYVRTSLDKLPQLAEGR